MPGRSSPLARYLFAAYVLLVAYASLHPLVGWRDLGLSPFAFLTAPWPRYYTAFDVAANFVGYLPLGALAVLAMRPAPGGALAIATATVAGTLLSVGLEALQTYLPERIPSNLDVLANGAGTLVGALAGHAVRSFAFAILFEPADAFEWATPGALTGLAIGGVAALIALELPRVPAATLAGLLLMAATVLVNIAPENPYLAHTLALWPQGHFLNFNGLTRLVSLVWPFAALVYVMLPAGTRATPASPA